MKRLFFLPLLVTTLFSGCTTDYITMSAELSDTIDRDTSNARVEVWFNVVYKGPGQTSFSNDYTLHSLTFNGIAMPVTGSEPYKLSLPGGFDYSRVQKIVADISDDDGERETMIMQADLREMGITGCPDYSVVRGDTLDLCYPRTTQSLDRLYLTITQYPWTSDAWLNETLRGDSRVVRTASITADSLEIRFDRRMAHFRSVDHYSLWHMTTWRRRLDVLDP